MFRYPCHDARG